MTLHICLYIIFVFLMGGVGWYAGIAFGETNYKHMSLAIAAILGLVILYVFHLNLFYPENSGIYKSTDGNAAYLQGDACIINMRSIDSLIETQNNYLFCAEKHMKYLSTLE